MYQLKEVRRNATPGAALQQNYHRGMIRPAILVLLARPINVEDPGFDTAVRNSVTNSGRKSLPFCVRDVTQ